jgi:hypothetical protein
MEEMTVKEAEKRIKVHEGEAAILHDEIDRKRLEKTAHTREISKLQQFIDAHRPPNPIPPGKIG